MRVRITLACTECKQRNYNSTKEKKAHPDRMETKKYCRFCKKHTMHKETKKLSEQGENNMSEMEKANKPGKFSLIIAEFNKVIWPDRTTVRKETTAVITVSVLLGLLIALLDIVLRYGVDFLISL